MDHKISQAFAVPTGLTEASISWQSKGLSNEKIRPPTISNNSISPELK